MGTDCPLTGMRFLFGVMHKTVNMLKTTERTSKTHESGGYQVTALGSVEEGRHCHTSGPSTGGLLTGLPLPHDRPGESENSGYEHQSRRERDENRRPGGSGSKHGHREARLPSPVPDTQAELTFVMATGLQQSRVTVCPLCLFTKAQQGTTRNGIDFRRWS